MWKAVFAVLAAVLAVGFATRVGGFSELNFDNDGVKDALKFAVVNHNRQSNDMFRNVVTEKVKVQSQVVSGINYRITVRMAKSSCRKDSLSENCPVHSDLEMAKPYTCEFTVWSQPWMNFLQVTKEECNP